VVQALSNRKKHVADVFVSYAQEDRSLAGKLATALDTAGYSVWWDRDLTGGARYPVAIEAQLNAAKAVLVVWTKASISSHWVADEAEVGRETGRLVPITPDGSMPPLGFRQFQVIDFRPWGGASAEEPFRQLLAALVKLAAPNAPGDRPSLNAVSNTAPANSQQSVVSIAVIPFVNMSSEPEQEYFSDGLSEELINQLAQIKRFRLAGRTSSFAIKVKPRIPARSASIWKKPTPKAACARPATSADHQQLVKCSTDSVVVGA
jgi:adenylate cyclase